MSTPAYWDYLRLETLFSLQGGLEADPPSPDELHFIIVHQAYELWFKLILSQLRLARDQLAAPVLPDEKVPFVVHHLGRVNEILKLCVNQWGVMETLPPQDFLAFRDKLIPASGFQSFQLREIEVVLGLPAEDRVSYGGVRPLEYLQNAGGYAAGRIIAARAETTLRDVLNRWLARTPIQGSTPGDAGDEAIVDAFLGEFLARAQTHAQDGLERAFHEGDACSPIRCSKWGGRSCSDTCVRSLSSSPTTF